MDVPELELVEFSFPNGRPDVISPDGGPIFNVNIAALIGTPDPSTAWLHVSSGGAFQVFPMTEISNGVYSADFPAGDCGTSIEYFFSVQTTTGDDQFSPESAPDVVYSALLADDSTETFNDNFQGNTGWTVSGNATDGQWARAVPAGGGCLLYTSPSPRDATLSRMPSSA